METQHNQNERIVLGIISYLGILVVVSYLLSKDDPFVKFHVKQGLVLFVAEIILWVVSAFFSSGFGIALIPLAAIVGTANLIILIFAIMGIVTVCQGKEKQLPLIGHFGDSFHI